MTPEEIAAAIAKGIADATKPLADQIAALKAGSTAADKAAADKVIADKAAADKVIADKAAADAAKGISPEVNSQMAELKRQADASAKMIADLQKQNKEANDRTLEAQKTSTIDAALRDFSFATPDARQTAFEKLSGAVQRNAEGSLIAGDNLTPEAFAKDFFPSKHAYLLAPEVRGGSGASATGAARGGKVATMEMMTPEMTPADRTIVASQISNVLSELSGRK